MLQCTLHSMVHNTTWRFCQTCCPRGDRHPPRQLWRKHNPARDTSPPRTCPHVCTPVCARVALNASPRLPTFFSLFTHPLTRLSALTTCPHAPPHHSPHRPLPLHAHASPRYEWDELTTALDAGSSARVLRTLGPKPPGWRSRICSLLEGMWRKWTSCARQTASSSSSSAVQGPVKIASLALQKRPQLVMQCGSWAPGSLDGGAARSVVGDRGIPGRV